MISRRIIISVYQYYFLNGFYCRTGNYSTSHPDGMKASEAISIHMKNRDRATQLLDDCRDGGYIDMKLPDRDQWIEMARKRDLIYMERIMNKMYCEFRKNPSLRLLDVMTAQLEDDKATKSEVARFADLCLGVANAG